MVISECGERIYSYFFCKSLCVIIAVQTLACKYACKSFLKSECDTNILTYGLNINGIVTCIRVLSVWIAVETLKTLRLLRMRVDPVWVRMHSDGLKQWARLPWMETCLQKSPLSFCVIPVTFGQVLTIGHQSCLQCLHWVLDDLHLQIHTIALVYVYAWGRICIYICLHILFFSMF